MAYARARFGVHDVPLAARLLIGRWDSAVRPRPRFARDVRAARRLVVCTLLAQLAGLASMLPAAAVRRRRELLRNLGVTARAVPRSARDD